MEIRIEHTTDYPWDLLLLADPNLNWLTAI